MVNRFGPAWGPLAIAAVLAFSPAGAHGDPPNRVVSMNLCTDQLAMLLAYPGQLISVSNLARDPQLSVMADRAAAFPANRGQAEEVFLMHPDLVLAGGFGGAPVAMLERLGVRVVTLAPPQSLEDVRQAITSIGAALERSEAAGAILADFDARLARLRRTPGANPPVVATWGANGYTAGADTLAGDVIKAAALAPLAARLGMTGSGSIPLETLVMADPALIVTGSRYPAASRAEEITAHPALARMNAYPVTVPDAEWACGIPQVLDALDRLTQVAEAVE